MNCPYCSFPFVGVMVQKRITQDSFELIRACSHCEAVLRFDITTLKSPKDKFRVNKLGEKVGE